MANGKQALHLGVSCDKRKTNIACGCKLWPMENKHCMDVNHGQRKTSITFGSDGSFKTTYGWEFWIKLVPASSCSVCMNSLSLFPITLLLHNYSFGHSLHPSTNKNIRLHFYVYVFHIVVKT